MNPARLTTADQVVGSPGSDRNFGTSNAMIAKRSLSIELGPSLADMEGDDDSAYGGGSVEMNEKFPTVVPRSKHFVIHP